MSRRYLGNLDVLARTKNLLQGGIVPKPEWLDAAMIVPPAMKPTLMKKKDIPKIISPTDRLWRKYFELNPQAPPGPLDFLHEHARIKHEAAPLIAEWKQKIDEGVPEVIAYQMAVKSHQERRAAEAEMLQIAAEKVGRTPDDEEFKNALNAEVEKAKDVFVKVNIATAESVEIKVEETVENSAALEASEATTDSSEEEGASQDSSEEETESSDK